VRTELRRRISIRRLTIWVAGLTALVFCFLQVPAQDAKVRGRTRNPHGTTELACTTCHTSLSWIPLRPSLDFDHSRTSYPLRGLHTGVDCRNCHVSLVFKGTTRDCARCHADLHRGQFGARCEDCHSASGWRISVQASETHKDRFPLIEGHAGVDCESCHTGGPSQQYVGLSTECITCHASGFNSTQVINHQAFKASTDCRVCHNLASWSNTRFDHAASGFPLTGAHAGLDCSTCHSNGRFGEVNSQCATCHLRDFKATSKPNHESAGFSLDCASCHSTATWSDAHFDHSKTPFPLTGGHLKVDCTSCHTSTWVGTSSECVSCHLADYQQTRNPNHVAGTFPQNCALCHTTAGWSGARLDHDSLTRFPLTGAHKTATCLQCHTNGQYAGTPMLCESCHLDDYLSTKDPNHVAAGFSQNCATCHSTAEWRGVKFDHSTTRFPLTGAHTTTACAACHVNGQYAGTSLLCEACHLNDFNSAKEPNHVSAGFPHDCSVCHNTTAWPGTTFNHDTLTTFPLTGAHKTTTCLQCHANNVFKGTSNQCVACHLTDYNSAKNPNHVSAGFSQDCALCHDTTQWQGAKFDHSATRFPLTGAHTTTACAACHVNGQYAGTSLLCEACHLKDFNTTTNPNHVAAGFPHDCSVCHSTTAWTGASFDHSKTRFPLTGAHITVTCIKCHVNNQFTGLDMRCVACHLAQFNATTNPNHVSAGFPQDCQVCHQTTAWTPASFDHSTTAFPLTGKHTTTACASCHVAGVYKGTPQDCYSCHKTEYQTVTNPNHIAAGFPQTCETCHNTTTWTGATFSHKFPIYSGTHAQRWTSCLDCHNNPSNYAVFTCLTCHEHNQTTMDAKHHDVRNYVYNSSNCYSCHPQGRGD
jgi:hypothetical protein